MVPVVNFVIIAVIRRQGIIVTVFQCVAICYNHIQQLVGGLVSSD